MVKAVGVHSPDWRRQSLVWRERRISICLGPSTVELVWVEHRSVPKGVFYGRTIGQNPSPMVWRASACQGVCSV